MRSPRGRWLFCDIPARVRAPQGGGHAGSPGTWQVLRHLLNKWVQQGYWMRSRGKWPRVGEITWSPHGVPQLSRQENHTWDPWGQTETLCHRKKGQKSKKGVRWF